VRVRLPLRAEHQEKIMAIIGFVLLAAAAVFGIEIVAMNDVSIDVDAFNQLYETSIATVFVAGVIAGLAGAIGLMLIRDGLVRRRRLRLEAREADEQRERHIAALEEEHAALALHRTEAAAASNREAVDLREPDRVTTH
jgi:flagellar biosynthesis/type III secretory pathway M-ring protein FliF/YscJ